MGKRHLIISGTGRAGTTFLVQLFTLLDLDTGYSDLHSDINPHCDAGMELDIRAPDAPYVIKSPWLCSELDGLLERGEVQIDHAIVPIRNLYAAAQSRREVSARTDAVQFPEHVPGGLWLTENAAAQEAILAEQFYRLMFALTKHRVSTTLLLFPRLVLDPSYVYSALSAVLGGMTYSRFEEAFQHAAHPELVHDYQAC